MDRRELQGLVSGDDREALLLCLYELAGVVAKQSNRDREDYQQELWLHAIAKVGKYQPEKGDAYSFFYSVMSNHLSNLSEVARNKHKHHLAVVETKQTKRKERSRPAEKVKTIRCKLRKAIQQAGVFAETTDGEELADIITGITYLQRFYLNCWGRYVYLRVKGHCWGEGTYVYIPDCN